MKNSLILAVLLTFGAVATSAQAQISDLLWVKTYGGVFDDYGRATASLSNGDVVSVGNFFSTILRDERLESDGSAILFRHDVDGNLTWSTGSGLSNHDRYSELIVTSDENFVVVGKTQPESAERSDALVQCFDDEGTLLWSDIFGRDNHDIAICVTELLNGDILVGVRSYANPSQSHSSADVIFQRYDANGNRLSTELYQGSSRDYVRKLLATNDGGFVALVDSRSHVGFVPPTHGNFDMYLVKFDEFHQKEWVCQIGGSGKDASHDVIQSKSGGFVVIGQTTSTDVDLQGRKTSNDQDAFIAYIDPMGHMVWLTAYGSAQKERANAILELPFGGYVVGGYSMERTHPFGWEGSERTINLVHVTNSGTVSSVFLFGGSGADNCVDIAFDALGDVYMTGWTTSEDGNFRDSDVEDVDYFMAKFGLVSMQYITDVNSPENYGQCNHTEFDLIHSYLNNGSDSDEFTFRTYTIDGKEIHLHPDVAPRTPVIVECRGNECTHTLKLQN